MTELTTQPKPPVQQGFKLKPGYVVNPFLSLSGCEPNGDIAQYLYDFAHLIDQSGTKNDFSQNLDFWSFEVRKKAMWWCDAAQTAWKVKQYCAWEPHFSSFSEWCEVALGKSVATVNSWIRAAGAISDLIASGFAQLPQLSSVALELSKLPDGEMQDTWRELCDRYPEHQINLEKLRMTMGDPMNQKEPQKNLRVTKSYWEKIEELAAHAHISSPSRYVEQIVDYQYSQLHPEDDTEAPINYFPEVEIEIVDDLSSSQVTQILDGMENVTLSPELEQLVSVDDEDSDDDPGSPIPSNRIEAIDPEGWIDEARNQQSPDSDYVDVDDSQRYGTPPEPPYIKPEEPPSASDWTLEERPDLDESETETTTNDTQLDEVNPKTAIRLKALRVRSSATEVTDPLSEALLAKAMRRIKDVFESNVFKGWAVVEWSGRVLPLSEWMEVF